MLFWTIVKLAIKSLLANKLRTFLAMLGIIIGVAAVISMLALGAGAQDQVIRQMSAMGTNLLVVRPGRRGHHHGVRSGSRQNLVIKDAIAILNDVPGVQQLSPVVRGSAQVKYYNKNTNTNVMGVSMTYFPIRNYTVERGRAFTEGEVEGRANVAVLGPVTAKELFGTTDPLGETIKVDKMNFTVIGILKAKGDQGWFNPDDQLIVPYTIAMKQLFGVKYLREIDLQVKDGVDLQKVEGDIAVVLRKTHRLAPGAENDFYVRNQAEVLEAASSMTETFTILLGGIAGISLFVGGIGIMNIMLVTVTERTREIGIRKSIGAKNRDILSQFLLEAILLSGIGGILGISAGFGISNLIGRITEFAAIVTPFSIILAFSFSAGVGIFFGYYPAQRAAKLDPVDALRYE